MLQGEVHLCWECCDEILDRRSVFEGLAGHSWLTSSGRRMASNAAAKTLRVFSRVPPEPWEEVETGVR